MASPKPGPAVAARHRLGLETVEDPLLEFRIDAAAGVGDPEQDIVAVSAGAHADDAAFRGEADGIGEEIVQDLLHPLADRR